MRGIVAFVLTVFFGWPSVWLTIEFCQRWGAGGDGSIGMLIVLLEFIYLACLVGASTELAETV